MQRGGGVYELPIWVDVRGVGVKKKSDIDPQFTICSLDFFCQYAFKWLETDSMLSSDFFISTSALYFLVLKLESCLAMHFAPLLISRLFHRLRNQKAYIHVKLYMQGQPSTALNSQYLTLNHAIFLIQTLQIMP